MRFEVYQDTAGGWRWRLRAGNGETVADSSEAYTRPEDVERAIRTVRGGVWRATVVRIPTAAEA